jgi:hypothetical protein
VEKRKSQRIFVSLNTVITPGGNSPTGFLDKSSGEGIIWYKNTGVIENLSRDGFFVKVLPSENGIDSSPGARHKVTFQLLAKDVINLNCEVVWTDKRLLHGFGSRKGIDPPTEYTVIGMKIIIPTSDYRKFYKTRLKQHH